jgi:hypothetical protein
VVPEPRVQPERRLPSTDDDELGELPPLDGATDDDGDEAAEDLKDDEIPSDDGDPFDDETGEGDAVPELEGEEAEHGWLADAADAETLDVGVADVVDDGEDDDWLRDNDEPGVGDEDFELETEDDDRVADAGEEGPEAEDEALREEDLPRLDADEDGEADDASFYDPLPDAPKPATGRTPDQAWDRVVGQVQQVGAVHAVACATRGVLAGGTQLVRVDLEGGVEPVAAKGLSGAEVTGLCFDGAVLVAVTERGIFVSRDAGATFAEGTGWRERVSTSEAAGPLDVVLGVDHLWARTTSGKLLTSGDLGTTWEIAETDGFVLAIGADDKGALVTLTCALGGAEVVRGVGEATETTRLPGSLSSLRPGAQASITARGAAVALATLDGGVARTLDGQAWSHVEGTEGAVAVQFIDGTGTLLAVTVSEEQDGVTLVRVSNESAARVVASIDGDGGEGSVALTWDEAHAVAWVGGAFGLVAYQPPMRRSAD